MRAGHDELLADFERVNESGASGFKIEGGAIDLFSMITTVGAPQTVGAEEIRLETMFPADEDAERRYLDFVRASS